MAGISSENKQDRMSIFSRIYTGICLFPILLGTFLCMKKILGLETTPEILVLTAGILSLCLEILYLGKIQKIVISLLFFFFLGIVAIKDWSVLTEGGKELANHILELMNQYQRTDFLLWFVAEKGVGTEQVFLLLCAGCGFLQVLLISCTRWRKKRNFVVLSLPLLVTAAGLLVGIAPLWEGVLLVLAGVLAVQLEPGENGMLPLGIGMGFVLGIAVVFSGSSVAAEIFDTYHDSWLKRQVHLEDKMLEIVGRMGNLKQFFGTRAQSEYTLSNEGPHQSGKEVFRITVAQLPEQEFYVRGFIGGDYRDGRWEKVSVQEFSDWAQKQGWTNRECRNTVQNFPYEQMENLQKSWNGTGAQHISMELEQPVSGYTLSPYYTKIPEEQPAEGDGALTPRDQKEFQWESFLYLDQQQKGSLLFLEERPAEKIWNSYGAYVQEVYTRLPEQGLEDLREIGADINEQADGGLFLGLDSYEAVSGTSLGKDVGTTWQVRNLLWQDTYYSTDLEPVPEGKDFAEYFLLEQKKGYCVHYATTGTLLLRMCGIPARYVSGYVVFPEDFKKNSDGTYTAVVTDWRAHAWTEMFREEVGFFPLEFTPSAYVNQLSGVETKEDMEHVLKQQIRTRSDREEQEVKKEPELSEEKVQRNQREENQQEEQQAEAGHSGNRGAGEPEKEGTARLVRVLVITIFFLAAAASLFLLLRCLGKQRQKRRQAVFFQEDRARGALAMGKAMRPLLKALGLEQKKDMGDLEYGVFLEQELPEMEWRQGIFLLQKAAFSEQGITEEEFQAVTGLYRELEQKVAAGKGKLWKWFFAGQSSF